jgi:hypothetical protein
MIDWFQDISSVTGEVSHRRLMAELLARDANGAARKVVS